MNEETLSQLKHVITRVSRQSPFYRKKFELSGQDNGDISKDIKSAEDFSSIPFTTKDELRAAYPLGLQAVPDERVVRVHSSSGTTGVPIMIPYSANDVFHWAEMMKRCYEFCGVTVKDRIQITPGYGLWTAGIGFQAGAELLGALAVPTGPGNTEKQLQLMIDLQTTVLTATSSYALLLAEEVTKRGLRERLNLKTGIFGSERWGVKMRQRIAGELGIEAYDIYGLTEIYGPGISIECPAHHGLHYWDDYLYLEIIDPLTGKNLPVGEYGELVITTLHKEAAPLVRFRTRDLTRLIPGKCTCGSPYPRHDRIIGRTDDMVKVKGVNIFPAQVDELLKTISGASSEYQLEIENYNGRDVVSLRVESEPGIEKEQLERLIAADFKKKIGVQANVEVIVLGNLPRSEKKTNRIIDNRVAIM